MRAAHHINFRHAHLLALMACSAPPGPGPDGGSDAGMAGQTFDVQNHFQGRLVQTSFFYVNGKQRLCNDFPNAKLTQAETAVACGQVPYHTAARRLESSRDSDDRTGQRCSLENSPCVDERDWDNVGFEANVGAPSDFDAAPCYGAP
jgi:hypothetical protein